jgi:RNA polymerase sigma-70 factor (ECF subfamily)
MKATAMGEELYKEFRPLMLSIAYRLVGSVSEAEDIVQDAFLRLHRAGDPAQVDSPKAYLSTITTRLAIDHLRSARVRRETYMGPWLPEPILEDPLPDAERSVAMAESLSMAFLVLLESLSPVERAVFLLREVFDYDYDEIARIVEKSEDNCRQLAARARRRIDEGKPRFEADRKHSEELVQRFLKACTTGDATHLTQLLAKDVVVYTDGGGKVVAATRPIHGSDRVARFLLGIARQGKDLDVRLAEINGQPGYLVTEGGHLDNVVVLDIADGLVKAIRVVRNPDKLRHLEKRFDFATGELRKPWYNQDMKESTPIAPEWQQQWLEQWNSASVELALHKKQVLQEMTHQQGVTASDTLLALADPSKLSPARRHTSGLVEQQALLHSQSRK